MSNAPDPDIGASHQAEVYRLLVEGVKDYAIFLLDPTGHIASWNAGAERITGYRADEILGQHLSRFYTPEEVAGGKPERDLEVAAERGRFEAEGWRLRKDGLVFWANVAITALRDEGGRLEGFSKITRDLSERKQADESLRSVVNHVIDGIITIDERGDVRSFNPAAERIFGYRAAEVLGKNVKLLMPEPYRGEHDGYLANYHRTGRPKIIGIGREVVGRRSDGSTFPMDLAVSEFRLDNRRFFTGIVRDITDRKAAEDALREAEERMRSVVNNVVDGIITIDERGAVESFNPAAERIFGYRAAEVLGKNVKLLMPEPYRGEHDGYLANYHRTGRPKIIGIGREVAGRRSDGSTFPMELAVSEFQLGGRRFYTGIIRDITDRKRLEQELRHRLAELAETDRRKDEFLAMLAHELRNPLAAINNAVHLTTLTEVHEQIEWSMEVISRQIRHLSRLIDDLLDVSRITRGKIQLRKERIDVAPVVSSAIDAVRSALEERKHELTVSMTPGTLWVEADPTRLEQILVNLLTNAVKYTEGGGRISVLADQEGKDITVKIRDTGVGIPPEVLPRMFELFAQGDRSLARSEGGLGIGLTLARSLAEMHGGGIDATSEGVGRGSEFVLRLPSSRTPMLGRRGPGPMTARAAGQALRILVVDDNVDTARGLARLLKLLGHDIQTAYDGPSAIESARAHRPDVVLLDIGLPIMDGYEVARRLRREECCKDSVIIAITGYGQDEDRRLSQAAGFDYHLVKPVDYSSLVSLISVP